MKSKAIVVAWSLRLEPVGDNRRVGADLCSRVADRVDEAMTARVGDIYMMEPVGVLVPERWEINSRFVWVWGVESKGLSKGGRVAKS